VFGESVTAPHNHLIGILFSGYSQPNYVNVTTGLVIFDVS